MLNLLGEALRYSYRTINGMTGAQIVRNGDAAKMALLALAGDEMVGGLDMVYANILVCDPMLRMDIERVRVRNTSALR